MGLVALNVASSVLTYWKTKSIHFYILILRSADRLVLLILQICKKRFFHGAILSSVHYLLFNNCNGLGYKWDAGGAMMSQLILKGVIA